MMKQRLKQREQDHVDQIMILKKSLEKKVSHPGFPYCMPDEIISDL